jgi:hypothetical protein
MMLDPAGCSFSASVGTAEIMHPTTLPDYRKSFRPSVAKGDPSDAGLLPSGVVELQ